MTFIEILVTTGIILSVVLAITNSLNNTTAFLGRVRSTRNRDRVVTGILQDIVQNVSLYQKNFNLSAAQTEAMLNPQKLPIAWSQDTVVPVAQCPTCPGRLGFIIQPLTGNLIGLNQLTIRITYPNFGTRDYVFILSDN